jgi:hypothetical protein
MTASAASSGASLRQGWSFVAILLAGAVFAQSVFAGAMLSGEAWARQVHGVTAFVLIASTAVAALVSLLTLRRISNGLKLGLTLLALAIGLALQIAVGKLSADGAGLMWVHVPLGVALMGLSGQAVAVARRLGG